MADNVVKFTVNLGGNAYNGLVDLGNATDRITSKVGQLQSKFMAFGNLSLSLAGFINVVEKLGSKFNELTAANAAQQEVETKLGKVMRNTMGASADEIQSIKDLATAQQQLGVIGDEVQLSGAQELATYLGKAESLQKLMPVMNDMLAQQYGLNASQEQATQVAAMMGKVMDGQVGALSRYGYKFDEAQEKILKYGTEAEKVETLAEVIGQSVGGMNEALANTPEGQIKQVANRFSDIKERIGNLIVRLQGKLMPVMNAAINFTNRLIDKAEQLISWFKEGGGWATALKTALIGLAGGLLAVSAATKIKAAWDGIAAISTLGWKAAMDALNLSFLTSPIFWIVAIIAAVAAAIVIVAKRTEGWGATWHNTMEYIKLSFAQCKAWLQTKWLEIEDSFLTGFENIKIGWYMLQSLWDKDAAAEGLAHIQEQRDQRARAIAAAHDKIEEYAEARKQMEVWQVKWKKKDEKEDAKAPSTMDALLGAVNGPSKALTDGSGTNGAKQSASATATGGTRNTTVNINLGKMVESIVFNGGYAENEHDMEQRLAAMLSRILGMAEATAG